jgi:phosphatidylserine/phosphatidylglycerophosphate/cardiolipin synthase-like enzyme
MALLEPGRTCWRVEPADRAAFLIDSQAYFTAAYEALLSARRQVILLGWGFDPRTRLAPDGGKGQAEPDAIGRILLDLAAARPDLDIYVLIWKSALPVRASQDFFPHRARPWFRGTRVHFHLDDMVPIGACHHQKVLVIDDQVAFVGGGDFCADRWDSTAHLDQDNRRKLFNHDCHSPRHEVMMMVDGRAAAALGDLSRERWRIAAKETIAPPGPCEGDPWPEFITPALEDIEVGIARTEPAWRDRPGVDEIRELTFASIARARRMIYLENQYLTSPVYAEALAARLAEPDGPQIVLMSTEHSPSWFDRATMDKTRALFTRRLRSADIFGRFRAFCPETSGKQVIIVHAKTSVFDDDVVRVGSANMNNRSGGFDTECELVVEARTPSNKAAIAAFRNELIGHYMGRPGDVVAHAEQEQGDMVRGIQALNRHGRLRPIEAESLSKFEQFIAGYHIGDPTQPATSMRPWKRRRELYDQIRSLAAGSRATPLAEIAATSKSTTNGK